MKTKNKTNFRLIYSHNQSAKLNMSIDKTLSTLFKEYEQPIMRFYTWEKSFTVGISQKTQTYTKRYPQYNNNCAKRMTGGGTLFHGHDISYSLVLPTSYLQDLNVKESYEKICTFLLNFYISLGLDAHYAKDSKNIVLSKSEFCQVGFEAYDIIANGLKIGGNAQKRSKNMIFQHGSIPLYSINNNKESGSSLEDLGIKISYEEAMNKLKHSFEDAFNVTLNNSSLNDKENKYLEQLLQE